ncbi:ferrous iron transport protein B [Maribrevibacterium harenarium]|uniref:Ferrous iron transport protein B n=1 Tax=Maribrevibacterium harenarium TaxID=2589817 RepID=A0A501WCF7_9GAMM|nr:ferrous iron transport protein B [Maribrevibacterium harenarium]TPE45764.1 ferrous iron transport protein B [Maribrevibacterium harenarium]
MSLHIALVGNPNTGKTTLFNKLAGTRQKVGNWSGVTVECKTGVYYAKQNKVDMTDLPGIYSFALASGGVDEAVARQFLKQGCYDVIVNIIDATNLKRNLKLTRELAELGQPMLVVLTMTDIAAKMGILPDRETLQSNLGVPVIDSNDLTLDALQEQVYLEAQGLKESGRAIVPATIKQWLQGVQPVMVKAQNRTEWLDRIVLHPWFGIPIFLFAMYAMFAIAIGIGSLFIDPIDAFAGYWFVSFPSHWLHAIGTPDWIITVLADGIGGGVQLVAGFIPVIAFLYLCLSILEDSGYMARAAFIVDRVMMSIGLPGQAFIPLLLGFGCNVPSIMATRALTNERQRMLTMAMAPFMSCGARLAVYAMFVSVFFRGHGGLIVFSLYLLGIVVAVGTAWLFRKQLFQHQHASSIMEMPHYHRPRLNNVGLSSWHKVRGFILRAGKTIVLVSAILTLLNSFPSWREGPESKDSALAEVGQIITPVFSPIGMGDDNWQAAVGVFTGVLAKEAVVGTLEALYTSSAETERVDDYVSPLANFVTVVGLMVDNITSALSSFTDPLGLSALDETQAQEQSHNAMVALFVGWQGAFAYLVFILLYTPCAASIGALVKEGGVFWGSVIVGWSTSIAYVAALFAFQILTFTLHPLSSSLWLLAAAVWTIVWVLLLRLWVKPRLPSNIIAIG